MVRRPLQSLRRSHKLYCCIGTSGALAAAAAAPAAACVDGDNDDPEAAAEDDEVDDDGLRFAGRLGESNETSLPRTSFHERREDR